MLTNSANLYVGVSNAYGNSLIITNGGGVDASNTYIGGSGTADASSSNNSILVTGITSFLSNSTALYVG